MVHPHLTIRLQHYLEKRVAATISVAEMDFVAMVSQLPLLVLVADGVDWIAETCEVIRESNILVSGHDLQYLRRFLTSAVSSSSTQSNWVKLEVSESSSPS